MYHKTLFKDMYNIFLPLTMKLIHMERNETKILRFLLFELIFLLVQIKLKRSQMKLFNFSKNRTLVVSLI